MINENFNQSPENSTDKTKIFIRYAAGTGGHFVGVLTWTLLTGIPVVLSSPTLAANECYLFEQYQNLLDFRDFQSKQRMFTWATNPATNPATATSWAKKYIRWYNTPHTGYVTCVHALNPDPLLQAFNNTKLLNISFDNDDIDQFSYNLVYKLEIGADKESLLVKANRRRLFNQLKLDYKKLSNLSLPPEDDLRLQTWIKKIALQKWNDAYLVQPLSATVPTYTIKFKDIMSGDLINSIPDLAKFLGVLIDDRTHVAAMKLVKQYAKSQQIVPWVLNFDDYE